MAVAFNQIPSNIRVPLFWAEVNSGVSYFSGNSRLLLVGQMLATGTATPNVPVQIQQADAPTLFGAGSMLVDMVRTARRNNPFGDIWALPLQDPAGTASTLTITLSGTPVPGVMGLMLNGFPVQVSVSSSDTPTSIAANLATAINAGYVYPDGATYLWPFTASASLGVLTLTSRHTGLTAGGITLGAMPQTTVGQNGALITAAGGTIGAGAPTLTAALAGLGTKEFDFIASPYVDATSLGAMTAFLSNIGGRWSPSSQLYGHHFTVSQGTLANLTTLGASQNDPHTTIFGQHGLNSPPWVIASAAAAVAQAHLNLGADLTDAAEISRPLQTLPLLDVAALVGVDANWSQADANTLLYSGIAPIGVDRTGQAHLGRVITTYQKNVWGSVDTTWLDVNTPFQTAYTLRYLKAYVTQMYPRSALTPDNPAQLQAIVTPTDIKKALIHAYSNLVNAGIAKNLALFSQNLIVEIAADPNRVNVYLPLDVVNQLDIFAVNSTTFLNAAQI